MPGPAASPGRLHNALGGMGTCCRPAPSGRHEKPHPEDFGEVFSPERSHQPSCSAREDGAEQGASGEGFLPPATSPEPSGVRTDLAQGPLLVTPPCSSILTLAVPGSCRAFTGSCRAFTGSSRAFTGSCKAFTGSYRAWPPWALLGHRESLAGRSTTCSCSHLLPISFFLVHLLSFSNSSRPARGFRAMQ